MRWMTPAHDKRCYQHGMQESVKTSKLTILGEDRPAALRRIKVELERWVRERVDDESRLDVDAERLVGVSARLERRRERRVIRQLVSVLGDR